MNNSANQQDQKVSQQLNHLQSFIGLPDRSGYIVTPSQVREYDRLILEKQAMGFEANEKNLLSHLLGRLQNIKSKSLSQIT